MTSTPPPDSPETPEPVPDPSPDRDPGWFDGLRGPRGCAEWTVVILGVVWAVLAVIFVIALVVRLSG